MIGTLNTKVTFSKIISIMELEINQRDAQGIDMELSSSPEVETPAGTPSPEVRSKKEKRKTSTSSISSSSPGRSKTRNLMSRLGRRTGQTANPGTEEEEEVGKGWRSLRHAVKVTNAVTPKKKSTVTREDSFLKKFSTRQPYRVESNCNPVENHTENVSKHETKEKHRTVFRMDGNLMLYWTGLVTVAVLYNLWTCIAREAFREIHENHLFVWITCDIVCDIVYVLDIVCQFRTGYLDQGLMVFDSVKLAKNYISTKYFYLDLVCLFPLDFIQFFIGIHPMVRFPRFIKLYRTFRFLYMLESRTAYPNFFRVANLTHILFLGSHWFAAFYYLISEAEDFKGDWSYPKPIGEFSSVTRKYLASLFWSTLTLTTIGDLPPPETNWEYVFVIVSYLIGVFIFATIVGQVGNVITNRNASRQEFERLLDGAKLYMRMHNVPPQLQKRVQRWYDYVWKRGRMKGSDINSLGMLPDKFKTELAIHVNLETLKKVTIFQECQPEFLHDLVLKMRAYIFTPGDLICRRGEVAREMFIIADGLVEIISETGTILTQMGTGDFFGEIGILNLDAGINRRTADVKSVGYSELFGLSREDVLEALKDHPEAETILVEYGRKRLKFSAKDNPCNGNVVKDIDDKKPKNSIRYHTGLYQPPYRNYIRVLQGTSKWPESFTLPDKITNIEEEHSPCGSPRICSRRTSVGSATPDSRATCCCYKLRHHFNDMEHKLGNMEEVYKNTLKMLSAISEQQILMMKEMSKPKTVLMEDSIDQNDPYLEITRL
ncbi:cyclic nucleotide-gated channel rod photoreceptor subunit alpha-like isoform X6 [Mizuhopecten yessoensis]|uniref:cyclic nucleotide-gated channel rod photoreceptor subunit alpha-like isoform X6 n=1 Tax=Mizuhopecten yessoensis TaxID=6573 RepID=UPI000B4596FF|nr:cyclic nucleotide-gated channel rod photoreceptor subunit alpha-like isoform X6 [Mizuhopecten yessoensis]